LELSLRNSLVNNWSNDSLEVELITDYGLGNGASFLFIQILFQISPNLCKKILENSENFTVFPNSTWIISFHHYMGLFFLQEGIRKVPLISTIATSYKMQCLIIPIAITVQPSWVMPIILTPFL
jgi:preprotein translocase subunit SecY